MEAPQPQPQELNMQLVDEQLSAGQVCGEIAKTRRGQSNSISSTSTLSCCSSVASPSLSFSSVGPLRAADAEMSAGGLEGVCQASGYELDEAGAISIADSDLKSGETNLGDGEFDCSLCQQTTASECIMALNETTSANLKPALGALPLQRLERSNSCSQAEGGVGGASSVDLDADIEVEQLGSAAGGLKLLLATTTTSISHENLPASNLASAVQVSSSKQQDNKQKQDQREQQLLNSGNKQTGNKSSRFFSSKLNTGSLWSLLSAGSTSSMQDLMMQDNKQTLNDNGQQEEQQQEQTMSSAASSFFSGFTRNQSGVRRPQLSSSATLQQQQQQHELTSDETNKRRFRFQLKYIGSAVLHKNFTLPMLEWIAKDIKRQTIRGAQSVTSQRQFTIPARDILFEIQANQLTAISCKDGHRVFIHPMHCVSKYAQLQQEPTCFSYLIRDTKESPTYCHVFQAKSAARVHDVFSAIREVATSESASSLLASLPAATSNMTPTRLQRSASSELPTNNNNNKSHPCPSQKQLAEMSLLASSDRQQSKTQTAGNQFENSYQFEVMFVKKVKLQCRRVPVSFVDDALETLRSFEVLKGGVDKTKGVSCLSKSRGIISASVDERQEYDEQPQSEQQQQQQTQLNQTHLTANVELQNGGDHRRGSSVSLHKESSLKSLKEESGTRSCQQSPTKEPPPSVEASQTENIGGDMKKHQSVDCLSNLVNDSLRRWPTTTASDNGELCYANDFSPYNTITSSDLNERIAAIPVVSSSSVSLDHETRQKLARQVRETIMATAANIKKGMYASGDKLDTTSRCGLTNSKALDSLSCVTPWETQTQGSCSGYTPAVEKEHEMAKNDDNRRASAGHALQQASTNNFDLFRRASARQVVKNRTMLLLIGKDELCTISIDKHQMLFSKSFSSIVHCLQGNNNKDHFGLICRDSGKINPQAENYAGFIFKCQSDKVVREIMGALKQVIYSSQHNYHGYNSPYNPLTSLQTNSGGGGGNQNSQPCTSQGVGQRQQLSLAYKRGFTSYPIEVDEAARHSSSSSTSTFAAANTAPIQQQQVMLQALTSISHKQQPKNLIKSMFCDDCPLYWYHRLCCDIESLPAEASKSIILRRIDSSLSEKEQDEIYSRFSEFNIDSISEHNEIFMSLLRHLCERKQLKHSQQPAHLVAMAKNSNKAPPAKYISSTVPSNQTSGSTFETTQQSSDQSSLNRSHQRSGSSSGSLALMLGHSSQAATDAGSAAMDNFKKAKNSISSSIENMLKRRGSSSRDDFFATDRDNNQNSLTSSRPGSFKGPSPSSRYASEEVRRRSPSASQQLINDPRGHDFSNNPLVGLLRRRSSTFGSSKAEEESNSIDTTRASSESLVNQQNDQQRRSPQLRNHPNSPSASSELSRFIFQNGQQQQQQAGGSSPSSMLSSGFWKRSIFDKIRQPMAQEVQSAEKESETVPSATTSVVAQPQKPQQESKRKRSREELRLLWKKAIIEQITLIKMERQNQRLQRAYSGSVEWNLQRVKLNYKDLSYARVVPGAWQRLLKQDPTKKVEFKEVAQLVRCGCPKLLRGEIWMFLMNQFQLRHGTSFQPVDNDYHGDANQNFRTLLTRLSVTQHEIFNDIGRTFPTHPYYSQYLSIGQLSLFNLLKAYSLLDPEVGYCQGLSFVAGILLLHVNTEDEAFELMRHFLFNFGLRKQYLPSMNALHLQLYQMTRLLKDYEIDLFNHFDRYDILPSLYAAPWFLTLFASQFPLSFVARLFDLISLIGIEAIFRVSLKLLSFHKTRILDQCHSLESTMDYIRHNLVIEAMDDDKRVVELFDESMTLDLRNKLIEYEIEYTFFRADERAKQKNCSTTKTRDLDLSTEPNSNEADQSGTSVADATATIIIQHILANNTQSSSTPS